MFSLIAFAVQGATGYSAEVRHPKAVVEMFTSQGCHSCPPADRIMAKFAREDQILALSWHVDYWDYLGWKDTFASKSNTKRQYAYARSLEEQQVYTPQAVVNGRTHVVGSKEAEIRKVIEYFSNDDRGMLVPIEVRIDGDTLKVSVGDDDMARQATLYMVFFNRHHDVKIKRGENSGKTLTYHNVVHDTQALGMVGEDGLNVDYPVVEMKKLGFDGCALLLQKNNEAGDPGAILGAAVIAGL